MSLKNLDIQLYIYGTVYTSPIRKLKIYTNSKFLCKYEITILMLKIPKQILTNV